MAEPNLYTSDSLYQPHILQPSIPQPQQVSVRYQEAPKLYATDGLFTKELVGPPKPPTQEEMQSYISQRDKELTSYDAISTLRARFTPAVRAGQKVVSSAGDKIKDFASSFSSLVPPKIKSVFSPVADSLKSASSSVMSYNQKELDKRSAPIIDAPLFKVFDESALAVKDKIQSSKGMQIPSIGIDTKYASKIATAIIEPIPTFFETTFRNITRQTEIKGLNILDDLAKKPYEVKYHRAIEKAYPNKAEYIKKNILDKFSDIQLLGIAAGAANLDPEYDQYRKEAKALLSDRIRQDPNKITQLKYLWTKSREKPEKTAGFVGRLAGYADIGALTAGKGFFPTTSRQILQSSFIARSESPKELATNIAIGAGFGAVGRTAETSKGFLQQAVGGSKLARGALEGTSYIAERAIKPYLRFRLATGIADIGSEYIYGDPKLAQAKERTLTTALATIPLGKPIGQKLFDKSVGLFAYDPNVYVEPSFPSRDRVQIAREHLSGKVREGTRAETPYDQFKSLTIRDPATVQGKGVTYGKELAFANPKMAGSKVQPVGSYFLEKSKPSTLREAFSGEKSPRIIKLKYQTPNLANTKLGKTIINQLETKGRVTDSILKQYLKYVQKLADTTGKPVGALSPKTLKGLGSSPTESEVVLMFPTGQGTPFGVPGSVGSGRIIDTPQLKFTGVSADTRTPVYSLDFTDTKPTYEYWVEKTQYNLAQTPLSRFMSRLIPSLDTKITSTIYYYQDGVMSSKTSKTTIDRLISNFQKSKSFDFKTFLERPSSVLSLPANILSDYEKAVNLKLSVLTGKEKSIPGFYELNSKGLGHTAKVYSELIKMRSDPTHPYYKTLNQFTKDELFKLSLVHDAGQIGTTPGYYDHGRAVGKLIDEGRIDILKNLPYDKQAAFAEAVSGHMSIAPLSAVSSKIKTPTIKDIGQGFLSGNLSKALADADKFARAGSKTDMSLIFSRGGFSQRAASSDAKVSQALNQLKSGDFSSFSQNKILSKSLLKPVTKAEDYQFVTNTPSVQPYIARTTTPSTENYIYQPIGSDSTAYFATDPERDDQRYKPTPIITETYYPAGEKADVPYSNYDFVQKPITTDYDKYQPTDTYTIKLPGYTPYTPTGYTGISYPPKPTITTYTSYTPIKPKELLQTTNEFYTLPKTEKPNKQLLEKAFSIQVKSKGKWTTIPNLKKKNYYAAHHKAQQMVDNYEERSYRLLPTNKKATIKRYSMPMSSHKFYRESKRKDPTLKDAWIEKSRFAIDSIGELRGITWKGIASQKKRGSKK